MGIFEKLGLVEEETTESEAPVNRTKIKTKTITNEDLITPSEADQITIDSIFKKAGLSDFNKSIYKVQELKDALPASLDLEAIKQSVLGVMKVSSLSKDEVLIDADKRVTALVEAKDKLTQEANAELNKNATEISELETRINELKQINIQRRKNQEIQEESINNEVQRIESIVKFIS